MGSYIMTFRDKLIGSIFKVQAAPPRLFPKRPGTPREAMRRKSAPKAGASRSSLPRPKFWRKSAGKRNPTQRCLRRSTPRTGSTAKTGREAPLSNRWSLRSIPKTGSGSRTGAGMRTGATRRSPLLKSLLRQSAPGSNSRRNRVRPCGSNWKRRRAARAFAPSATNSITARKNPDKQTRPESNPGAFVKFHAARRESLLRGREDIGIGSRAHAEGDKRNLIDACLAHALDHAVDRNLR